MSLNSGRSCAVDLRWRRQRKALDKARADRKAYARYVVLQVAESMEAEFVRVSRKLDRTILGVDVGGPDRTVVVVRGRQLGKQLYLDSILQLHAETGLMLSDPLQGLNEAALREIERILDDYEAASGNPEDTGASGVARVCSDLRELFGVRGGSAGGAEQKHG